MSAPAYQSYKDSGVEWIGTIPSHWTHQSLWTVAEECDRSNEGMVENNLLSLSYGRIVRKDIDNNDGLLPASFETYQIVEPHDVVWRLTDLQNDKRSLRTARVTERGIITSAYLATRPIGVSSSYFSYLLRAYDLMKVFYSMGGGLRQGMKFSDVKHLPILLPSATEQAAIAAFLDRETGKIDALIEAQTRLIELLKEKRQAVISHAVTKGLNPDAPMKDSGIEWLSQVPAHWEVKRLRFIADISTGDGDTVDADENGEYKFYVRSQNIHRINRYTHDCEAVLTSGDGAGVGKIYHYVKGKFTAHQRVYIFNNFIDYSAEFFFHYMKANFYKVALEGGAKSTVDSLRRPLIADFMMTSPPKNEQLEITKYLKDLISKFDKQEDVANQIISLLQERRAALISAAVTGKIDVRGLVNIKSEAA